MDIIIVGVGKVGYKVASTLAEENDNITVIDLNEAVIERVNSTLDVMGIEGNGVSVATLLEAGIRNCDILIAATANDEINMVCCLMGKKLGAKYTIARIREHYYQEEVHLLKEELDLDLIINPEEETAQAIAKKLQYPSGNFVESFGMGGADLVELLVDEDSILKSRTVADISTNVYSKILIAAVLRDKDVFIPNGSSFIEEGDNLYVIGNHDSIVEFFRKCGIQSDKHIKNIMIAGGGRIALYLSELLKPAGMKVKVIEEDKEASILFANAIENGVVIHGDSTEEELLISENLKSMDAFVALTDDDEDNLMSSLLAVEHKVPRVITKINKVNYMYIVRKLGIRSVVSPSIITATGILKFIRMMERSKGSYIESLHRILGENIEITEYKISGQFNAIGIPLMELNISQGVLVAVILRGKQAIIPNGHSIILEGDSIILIANQTLETDINTIFSGGEKA